MGRVGKKYRKAQEAVAGKPQYPLPDAIDVVTKSAFANFDETVEVALRLGVNPKHADQMVRGTVILPHGLGGKSRRVLVIAAGEKAKEAEETRLRAEEEKKEADLAAKRQEHAKARIVKIANDDSTEVKHGQTLFIVEPA